MKNIVFVLIVVICAGISYSSVSSINTTVGFELSEMLTLKSAHAEDCEDDESEYTATQDDCPDGTECECTMCFSGAIDCTPTCPCC